eukprot:s518_g5.t1
MCSAPQLRAVFDASTSKTALSMKHFAHFDFETLRRRTGEHRLIKSSPCWRGINRDCYSAAGETFTFST